MSTIAPERTAESVTIDPELATTDDPARATHIVWVPSDVAKTAQAYVTEARVFGLEVEALCGYRWVPQRDPKDFPLCAGCKAIYDESSTGGDRDNLPDA